jgi:uncharacterized protein
MRIDFDGDPAKAASNAVKHKVGFEEAVTICRDPFALSLLDDDPSTGEERWITLGLASSGNLLVVVHTWVDVGTDQAAVRIISARRPTRNETRQYQEG